MPEGEEEKKRRNVSGNIQGNPGKKTCRIGYPLLGRNPGQQWGTFQNVHLLRFLMAQRTISNGQIGTKL